MRPPLPLHRLDPRRLPWPLCWLVVWLVVWAAGEPAWAQGPAEQPAAEPGSELPPTEAERDAAAVDAALQGKPIGRISFGCDLQLCADPLNNEFFAEITGLSIGQPYSTTALRRGEERLAKTGFFEKLTVEKSLVDGAVFVDIQALGATLIRRVTFENIDAPPFESELRKILLYRQGQQYRDDREKASAQLESLEGIFEREGYYGTRIAMVVEAVEGTTHLVDINFRIDKGNEREICDIGLRGVRAMPYAEARDLLLSENSFLPRRFNLFGLTYTTRGFKAGQQALIDAYRRRGFFQARILDKAAQFADNGACVTLLVDLSEGPRWELRFEGNERFSANDLTEELPFFESGYVDAEEIQRAERAIAKLYETRGYPFAEVRGRESRRDRLDRILTFQIDEGPQLEIRELIFHGNQVVTDEAMREVMGTRTFGLFETGGYLQTDELLGDALKIEELYRNLGYLQAYVERFEVEVLPEDAGLRIHVVIEEGVPTLTERLEIDGNRTVSEGSLARVLNVGKGDPFVPLQLKADLTKLIQTYSSYGYPMARFETTCRLPTGESVPCEAPRMPRGCLARAFDELQARCRWTEPGQRLVCQRRDPDPRCTFQGGVDGPAVQIKHRVEEGPLVRTGQMLLGGNFDTSRDVIYREVPLERGDLLDTRKLVEAQGNLRSLNLFDSVSIETIGLDEGAREQDEATAAILINVEESRTRSVDVKFGLEFREVLSDERRVLVTGEAEYNDRNLFGLGQGITPRLIAAVDTLDLFELGQDTAADLEQATRVTSLDHLIGAELIYSHPRFLKGALGIDKLHLTLSPFYLIDLVGVINSQVLREEWGVRTEARKELFEIVDRFFLKLGLEFKQIATFTSDDPVIAGTRIFSPRRTVGKLTPELLLDRRDSPLNPGKGYILRLTPSLVSGDALGQGGEDFLLDSYLRASAAASFYLPLWKDVVFAQSLRAAQIFPLFDRENPVPPEERFFLGGVRSLRGFEDNSLGPVSDRQLPTGGEFLLNYNAEIRYPLLPDLSIYGATFFDAGLLSDCRREDSARRDCYDDAFTDDPLSEVRTAAGLGLRALILDQIPVVLDYGIVLNRRPGEKFGQLHLNVGYTFD